MQKKYEHYHHHRRRNRPMLNRSSCFSRRHPLHPFKVVIVTILVSFQLTSFYVEILPKVKVVVAAAENDDGDNDYASKQDQKMGDTIEDSLFDPLSEDPSCEDTSEDDCFSPPKSTVEEEVIEKFDPTCFKGAGDEGEDEEEEEANDNSRTQKQQGNKLQQQQCGIAAGAGKTNRHRRDKHWGDDPKTLSMRDQLREQSKNSQTDSRPPIFLIPGLAATRLVAWKFKKCVGALSSEIKVQDTVWLNINLLVKMGTTIDVDCMKQCLELGLNQTDFKTDVEEDIGCKLRPDEGLDAIASLAPGGIGAEWLVGGTNTVYSWLIQWLADNLGYDVTNIIGLPYDWRLTPSVMETRDGFLNMMRKRIEAAVISNKHPGIMVAHSMGNSIFRYFIEWLRVELREEAYQGYVKRAKRRAQNLKRQKQKQNQKYQQYEKQQQQQQQQQQQNNQQQQHPSSLPQQNNYIADDAAIASWTSSYMPGWVTGIVANVSAEVDEWYDWFTDENNAGSSGEKTTENEAAGGGTSNSDNNGDDDEDNNSNNDDSGIQHRDAQFWELAKLEGDENWVEWLQTHVWTYVGLGAPMLGAINPLRAVISGENMGLPVTDDVAREIERTFGSTHTLNPVSTNSGFCDDRDDNGDWGDEPDLKSDSDVNLACLDDIMNDIEYSSVHRDDPWKHFPALKALMRDRIDWVTGKPMIDVDISHCNSTISRNSAAACEVSEKVRIGAKEVEDGSIFQIFNNLWKEKGSPLIVKKEQLEDSFVNSKVANILDNTWNRPLIKHIIMSYGVDIPTEVGYVYSKKYNVERSSEVGEGETTKVIVDRNETEFPDLKTVLWENPRGLLSTQQINDKASRSTIGEYFIKKKPKREPFEVSVPEARLRHSGDGSVPYLSLSWAQTWLLHAARARRFTEDEHNTMEDNVDYYNNTKKKNALDYISISHRPQGESDWIEGPAPEELEVLGSEDQKKADSDTGTSHPHGTRYKPLMKRYHNVGKSRTTGIKYTTSVIEAIGVEHKETTR